MEGFDARRVSAALEVPNRYLPGVVVAMGYSVDARIKSARYPPEAVMKLNKFTVPYPGVEQL